MPGQLPKSEIAVQVVQPDNSRVRTATQAMRTEGKGSQGSSRQERIRAPCYWAWLIVIFGGRIRHFEQPEQLAPAQSY